MTISHPPFDRLADLAEGLLDAADRTAVERHVSTCSRCADDVAWLTHTISLMRSDDSESAPDHVINRAVRVFNTHTAASEPRSAGIVERLIAIMRFDSAHAVPAFGLRVGTDEASRQFLFDAQPYELELRTRPMAGGWGVAGQLLGPAETVDYGEVELIGDDARVHAPLSELLEFSLPAVPSGTYRLELRFDDERAIEIPTLELGT
jgi:anti-sigma factor RsiW